MTIVQILQRGVAEAVKALFNLEIEAATVSCTPTRKEFEGDYTAVVFPYAKAVRKSPLAVGEEIGHFLVANVGEIAKFNVIQGFLNISMSENFWCDFIAKIHNDPNFGVLPTKGERVMIEYSSPNTNKPLHLGHVRNILIGCSVSNLLEAAGYEVVRTQVINDRGVAICKSMLAWKLFANGATPATEGVKSDHFVGDYYVLFEKKIKAEYDLWQQTEDAKQVFAGRKKQEQTENEFFKDYKNEYFNKNSSLGKQVKEMLLLWEQGDTAVRSLWSTMNGWVYEGFNTTYEQLGARFDKNYYESETYELGRDIIFEGLKKGIFYQKPDSSVWIDLADAKLDQKLVLRSDGTSVYITQDIGMAHLRYKDFAAQKVAYVVADEQNYHFQVLFEIAKRLGEPYAEGLHHLSYGLVELPTGRMKTREGTVVDADDLIAEVISLAQNEAKERGMLSDLSAADFQEVCRRIGLGALKYYLLKVNPKKKMVFNPDESVKLEGNTGSYIQYPFVRISKTVRDALHEGFDLDSRSTYTDLQTAEKDLILKLYQYETLISEAAAQYDPSVIANYCYELAVLYNKFWHDVPIFKAEDHEARRFRLQLSRVVGNVLQSAMGILGVDMPEKM
jgi:arginyl-tRNA synthetase